MEKSCCFTGHRVITDLGIIPRLDRIIARLTEIGIKNFYCGGALGFDTLAADAVLRARENDPDIRLVLALPCREQAARWKQRDIDKYEAIKSLADEVIYTSEHYSSGCMHIRNRYLVDHSKYCICYMNKTSGGTYYTVNYASKSGLIIYNIFNTDF